MHTNKKKQTPLLQLHAHMQSSSQFNTSSAHFLTSACIDHITPTCAQFGQLWHAHVMNLLCHQPLSQIQDRQGRQRVPQRSLQGQEGEASLLNRNPIIVHVQDVLQCYCSAPHTCKFNLTLGAFSKKK